MSKRKTSPKATAAKHAVEKLPGAAKTVAAVPPAAGSKPARKTAGSYRTTQFMAARSLLLRCLLQDARLQRCIQLVP